MNGAWIQAGGFENVLPFIILILWIVGKVMNARAEARARQKPPGDAGPRPARRTSPPAVPEAGSGEEQLRRFLAELTGVEPPPPAEVEPPAYEPPAPLPDLPPLPGFRPAGPARPPMVSSVPGPSGSPEPFSLRRSVAERNRRRRMRPPPPPPVPLPVAAPVRRAANAEAAASAEAMTAPRPQARPSVMPTPGLQGITMGGPHLGAIASATSAGRPHAAWNARALLAGRRRLREAMILRTILAPPRALDPM